MASNLAGTASPLQSGRDRRCAPERRKGERDTIANVGSWPPEQPLGVAHRVEEGLCGIMAELNPPSAERLARFEVAYMEALPGHPAEIEADAQAWQAFYRRIHNLAGSGGAFDFP